MGGGGAGVDDGAGDGLASPTSSKEHRTAHVQQKRIWNKEEVADLTDR